MPEADLITRLGRIIGAIDRALDTETITDIAVLDEVRESIRTIMRDAMIVEVGDGGQVIARHLNSRYGTDPMHGLIGQYLHEMGYRLPPKAAAIDLDRPCAYCEHRYGAHSDVGCTVCDPEAPCRARPTHGVLIKPRLRSCVEAWPECNEGDFDPRCCRFPKSCSADVYDDRYVSQEDLEPPRG